MSKLTAFLIALGAIALTDTWRDRQARVNAPFIGRMPGNPIMQGPAGAGLVEGLFAGGGLGGLLGGGSTAGG